MGVNLGKDATRTELAGILVRVQYGKGRVSADLDLVAFLLDRTGKAPDSGAVVFHGNTRSADGGACWSRQGSANGEQSLTIDFDRLNPHVLEFILGVSLEDATCRLNFGQVERACVTVSNFESGNELHRWELDEDYATETTLEFLRGIRVGRGWQVEPLKNPRQQGLAGLAEVYAPRLSLRPGAEVGPSNDLASTATARQPHQIFSELVRSRPFDAYCSVADRQALIREASLVGMDESGAKILLDLELEQRGIVNEHALLERLESILRRFTDHDKKLDEKERRDALQLSCRPEPGYGKGLRYDIAEQYLIDFCRRNRVRIKVGFLKWAVP